MNRHTADFAALLASSIAACTTKPDPRAMDLAARNDAVISPEHAAPLGNVDVLLNDRRIVFVGRPGGRRAHREIDGSGRFSSPGPIDGEAGVFPHFPAFYMIASPRPRCLTASPRLSTRR